VVNNQWNPGYNNETNQKIIDNLVKGSKFRFRSDPDGDRVYEILNVTTKRLYNHTPWNKSYKWDGGVKSTGDSVEDYARRWADDLGGGWGSTPAQGEDGPAKDLMMAIERFGLASNRRVCYIIEVDKNPCEDSSNVWDPTDPLANHTNGLNTLGMGGGGGANTHGSSIITFVKPDVDVLGNLTSSNPAVWETEPKESADLNIYYEASNAIPIKVDDSNNELFARPGSRFRLHTDAREDTVQGVGGEDWDMGVLTRFSGDELPMIREWESDTVFTVGGLYAHYVQDQLGSTVTKWIGKSFGFPAPHNTSAGGETYYVADAIGEEDFNLYVTIWDEHKGFVTAKVVSWTMGSVFRSFDQGGGQILGMAGGWNLHKIEIEPYNSYLPVGLSWYNCISFGNGVESRSIRDDFNSMSINNGVRASSIIEEPYAEENRKSGLIYSGLYNSTSGVNNLNQFIAAEQITKDLNPTFGSIQKLFSRRISLIAFCEDRVIGITANKNALYNADGKPQVVATNAVLGDANPFVGDYGISKNPESFASESYRAYFSDKQRGAVLRLSMDGITPISDAGMRTYFKDNLKTAPNIIGTYDEYKKDYNLTFANYFHENLLINSRIEEGSVSFESMVNNSELLPDGMFRTGDNYTSPTTVNQHPNNNTFNQEVTITNNHEIAAVAPIPPANIAPNPANTITQGYGSAGTIYEWDYQDGEGSVFNNNLTGKQGSVAGTGLRWRQIYNGNYNESGSDPGHHLHASYDHQITADHVDSDSNSPNHDCVEPRFEDCNDSILHAPTKTYFPNAINSTIFNGEEISLQFRIDPWSGEHIRPRVTLVDHGTGTYVVNSLISTDPIAEYGLQGDGTGNTPITDPNDPRYVHTEPQNVNNSDKLGFQPTHKTGAAWLGGSRTNSTLTYRCYFKFLDTTVTIEDENGVIMPDPNHVVVDKLKIRVSGADDTDYEEYSIQNFRVTKTRRLSQPRILQGQYNYQDPAGDGSISAQILDPITGWGGMNQGAIQAEVAAVPESIDIVASIPDWSVVSGSTWDLTSQAVASPEYQAQYYDGLNPPPSHPYYVGTEILDVNGNALPSGNGVYTISPASINKTQTGTGEAGVVSTTLPTPFVNDDWYEIILTIANGSFADPLIVQGVLNNDSTVYNGDPNDTTTTLGNADALPEGYVGTWHQNGGIRFNEESPTTLKVIFKHAANNSINWNNETTLRIFAWDTTTVQINHIQIKNISDRHSHSSDGTFSNSWNNAGNWSFGGNPLNLHAYSDPIVWYHNNKVKFENAVYGNYLSWNFNSHGLNNGVNFPGESDDGYEIKFKIENYQSGSFGGYINDMNGNGFYWDNITGDGNYTIKGNFSSTNTITNNGDILRGTTVIGTSTGVVDPGLTSGHHGRLTFKLDPSSPLATFNIRNISFKDITNVLLGGSVSNWGFNGFEPDDDDFIVWDNINYNVVFNEAPQGVELVQEIANRNLKTGETYQLKFDLDNYTGSGQLSGYFYNENGDGFVFGPLDSDQVYDAEHVIGDATTTDGGIPRNTFVISVTSPEEFSGTLDNFFLREVFTFNEKTISYSEDVKGWTSFKSFIPENGISLSSNYYTFKLGKLWQHHKREDLSGNVIPRNTFYGQSQNSLVTSVLNNDPSDIKLFNTLMYEGTQSSIPLFTTSNDKSNASNHNLIAKDGWKVDSIRTDKQQGTVKEFIKKEGKWFNYIRGSQADINTENFSFQGLGKVSSIVTPEEL
jgi:hypothetical protein